MEIGKGIQAMWRFYLRNFRSYNVGLNDGRIHELHHWNQDSLRLKLLLQSWKSINLQAVIKSEQNCFKQEVKH
jgi:hypothetical protein